MKNVFMSFLVSAIALMSCSKVDNPTSSSEEIPVSATPASIKSFILENYPDATISGVFRFSNSDTTYTITLNTWEFLAFGRNEILIGEGLADSICDSIHDSIPGGHHRDGHHGNGHHGNGHHGGGIHDNGGIHHGGIPADSIPAAIKEYIATNFAGYTVHNAMYDTLCPYGIVIQVMIKSTDKLHHKLVFDAAGAFVALAQRANSTDLPSAVVAALKVKYPAYTSRLKAEVLTLADNSKLYIVYMHDKSTHKSVVFKEDGTVICEQ